MTLKKTSITLLIKMVTCFEQLITCIKMYYHFVMSNKLLTLRIFSSKHKNITTSSKLSSNMTIACLNQLMTEQYSTRNYTI